MSNSNKPNTLYIIIGVLCVGLLALGYMVYKEKNDKGFSITIDDKSIVIDD